MQRNVNNIVCHYREKKHGVKFHQRFRIIFLFKYIKLYKNSPIYDEHLGIFQTFSNLRM